MGFAMKMNLRNGVAEGTLKHMWLDGRKVGYEFGIQMDYYRGHWLSVIDELEITVDGEKVPEDTIKFCINGKEFSICQLESCYTEFWKILDIATIKIWKDGGLADGEHEIESHLIFRSPYMPIGPNHQFMPVDSSGRLVMEIQ